MPTDIKVLLVTSPAWPPVRCGRQGQAIVGNPASIWGNSGWEHSMWTPERKSLRGSGNTIPQESGCLLHSGDQVPWWQLLHNHGQGHQVQALLVRKQQRHCWCRSVGGRRVDRESFWGSKSLRQTHSSETHSRPGCSYLSVCVCPTEWSKWWG